jgi:hypothetical protein
MVVLSLQCTQWTPVRLAVSLRLNDGGPCLSNGIAALQMNEAGTSCSWEGALELPVMTVQKFTGEDIMWEVWNENLRPIPDTLIGNASLRLEILTLRKALVKRVPITLPLNNPKGRQGFVKALVSTRIIGACIGSRPLLSLPPSVEDHLQSGSSRPMWHPTGASTPAAPPSPGPTTEQSATGGGPVALEAATSVPLTAEDIVTVRLRGLRAGDLPETEWLGKQDPFAVVMIGPQKRTQSKTVSQGRQGAPLPGADLPH